MICKKDLVARGNTYNQNPEISPEVQKMTEGMVERWQRVGVKFDSQAATNPEVERQAERVYKFTHLINRRSK
jgi:hypothetical protein